MKKSSIRPLLTLASACLLPAALQAQTTLQNTPAVPAQPGGVTAGTVDQPMGTPMTIQMSPAASLSQPNAPVSSDPSITQANTFQFRATAGIERDDNVFRTNGGETSDEIGMLGVGVRADKRIGQQRLVADVEANRYSYNDLSGLDYSTLNYSAAWYWRFGSRWEGIASADRRQFRDISDSLAGAGTVSRRTERTELVEGGYRFGAAWRALAGVRNTETSSNDPRSFDANTQVSSVHFGSSHEFASGSTIAARYRIGNGEYENLAGSDFDDNELEVALRWAATVKTTLEGRLAYLNREHDTTPGRDFDGLVGSAGINWEITAKTRLMAGFARDLGSYTGGAAGHLTSNRFYLQPTWRATDQITVNARYERENRRWEDVAAASVDAGRKDTFNVLSAGVDWEPRRAVTVSGTVRNERRTSTLPALTYRANVIGVAVKLTL